MVDAFLHALQCRRLAAITINLRPAGNARLHVMAEGIAADQLGEMIVVSRCMRARSDNRHLAFQHIEELRQLVDARLAQPRANGRDALVAAYGLLDVCTIIENGHGAELEDLEFLAVEPAPRLHEE